MAPPSAEAVRWTLGVATDVTPLVVEPARPEDLPTPFRLGFRPVIELETGYHLSFSAYAPFTVVRSGEGDGAASTGAESVFGLGVSLRQPLLRDEAPEEVLGYVTLRGGFSTLSGRAGPFLGVALGTAATWLGTGRGLFAEVEAGYTQVGGGIRDIERVTLGLSLGVVFRLGGEEWRLDRN